MIRPMLATATSELPSGGGWAFEPKLDGYRCIATVVAGRVRLQSRSGGDMTSWFPGLAGLAGLGADLVLDGEVVCCDQQGRARFEWLASWRAGTGPGRLRYYPFDLLRVDGSDLRERRWSERTGRLAGLLEAGGGCSCCGAVLSTGDGREIWVATEAIGAEGVVAKRLDASYRAGRSRSWLKAKHRSSAWFDVVGWRPSSPGRPGGLVLREGDDVVGVAVVGIAPAERRELVTLIGRYGRRHPTGTVTVPEGALCARATFMARPGVVPLREAVVVEVRPASYPGRTERLDGAVSRPGGAADKTGEHMAGLGGRPIRPGALRAAGGVGPRPDRLPVPGRSASDLPCGSGEDTAGTP